MIFLKRLIILERKSMSRNELLDNWIEHRLITLIDGGIGYTWTQKAKKLIPVSVRTILASISNGKRTKQSEYFKLAVHHFDKKGFYHAKVQALQSKVRKHQRSQVFQTNVFTL